ncbi:MAG: hemolysin family protein [Candidatus Omnitrophota bacterium]|nr:hemolysin family protein [Candidatus Omnitrophota bacterium]MBU1928866.1 hemolysin family protein [Candidatus Omnitrophota bacterium]MBU2034476.1 hemolysin family protein [Candidatus Omnitrophota bacterium]MBU2221467.1 hemolysin family protein [Candidatus Omnitrophota bacterium]MBU2258632.1 hemolysin family protein [Candidatus Omnitrophota bacterium]
MFILFIVLVGLSVFFSLSETSIIGISRMRLRHMLAKGVKRASSIQRLIAKLDKFLAALLIGNNFVNIAMSSIITVICVQAFGYQWGVIIATLSSASFVVVFCEITPKIIATKHTERVAAYIAPWMELLIKILNPLVRVFIFASSLLLKILRVKQARRSPLVTQEELRFMIEMGQEDGVLTDTEKKMLHKVIEFQETEVSSVMIPKDKMVAVSLDSSLDDILNTSVEEGYAKLPVYSRSKDNIVGIIYSRDLLYILRDKGLFVLQDVLRKVHYVQHTMGIHELLKIFQADKTQVAIVINEHKKALGLVTLEDLMEEIVGEIEEKRSRER